MAVTPKKSVSASAAQKGADPVGDPTEPEGFLKVGALINLDRGGRTLQNLEVLAVDDKFLKLKWDAHVSPGTEIVLVPIADAVIGLVGER